MPFEPLRLGFDTAQLAPEQHHRPGHRSRRRGRVRSARRSAWLLPRVGKASPLGASVGFAAQAFDDYALHETEIICG